MVKTGPYARKSTANPAMSLAQTICQWIDLLWIPVALFTMERGKRLLTVGFVVSCALLLRLQVELMQQIGYPRGFFGFMGSAVLTRGQISYSVFVMALMILAHYSPGSDKSIHIAASISVMIAAFCVSTLVMVL